MSRSELSSRGRFFRGAPGASFSLDLDLALEGVRASASSSSLSVKSVGSDDTEMVDAQPDENIHLLKSTIEQRLGIPVAKFVLVSKGRVLHGSQTVRGAGLVQSPHLFLAMRGAGAGQARSQRCLYGSRQLYSPFCGGSLHCFKCEAAKRRCALGTAFPGPATLACGRRVLRQRQRGLGC